MAVAEVERRAGAEPADVGAGVFAPAILKAAMRLLALVVVLLLAQSGENLAILFFNHQDLPVLVLALCLLVALHLRPDGPACLRWTPPVGPAAAALIGAVFAVTLAGTFLVLGDYAYSRDELLVEFDAAIFSGGRLMAPVPAEWRDYAHAMMPLYMSPLAGAEGWASGYLPGNAALRALVGLVVAPQWTGPLLASVAALALYRVGRRLWPDAPQTALLPLLLLCASPQLLVTAMTPFAMTAHLAFNLLWLWCFLRDDRLSDAGALLCGFVATGLHQLFFHPLFAAPFIAELLIARRWRRAALFVTGYALTGLFWASYWPLVAASTGFGPEEGVLPSGGLTGLAGQVAELLASFSIGNICQMLMNLSRFVAWQHLLLIPLTMLAVPAIRHAEGIARPLAAGTVLMLLMLFVLMPWQGHGWGYRYLHGFMGSVCLLAGYGWRRVASALDRPRRNGALALATALTLLVVLPFHLWSAGRTVSGYRAAQAIIDGSAADVVLVDGSGLLLTGDVVRNQPDGSNQPKVMDIDALTAAELSALCARYDVALFDRRHGARAGIRTVYDGRAPAARRGVIPAGCATPLPPGQ